MTAMLTSVSKSVTYAVQIHATGPEWLKDTPYAVGVIPAEGDSEPSRCVLLPQRLSVGASVRFDPAEAMVLSAGIPRRAAALVPLVAEALRVWDTVGLELGGAAALTDGSRWAPLLREVASWYGAFAVPVSVVDEHAATGTSGVQSLRDRLNEFSLVCAVELSGRAEAVDLLLEAVPPQARVMLAGASRERLTIDYYMNVHRKGLHLTSTVLSAYRPFGVENLRLMERACRLLMREERVHSCEALAGAAASQF